MHLSDFFETHSLRLSPLKAEAEVETGFGYTWFIEGDCQEKRSERSRRRQGKELSKDMVSAGV